MLQQLRARFRNLSIGYKITLGFGVLLFFTLLIVLTNLGLNRSQSALRARVSDSQREVQLAAQLQAEVLDIGQLLWRFFAAYVGAGRAAADPVYQNSVQRVSTALELTAAIRQETALTSNPARQRDEQAAIDALEAGITAFQTSFQHVAVDIADMRGYGEAGLSSDLLAAVAEIKAAAAATRNFDVAQAANELELSTLAYARIPSENAATSFRTALDNLSRLIEASDLPPADKTALQALVRDATAKFLAVAFQDLAVLNEVNTMIATVDGLKIQAADFIASEQNELTAELDTLETRQQRALLIQLALGAFGTLAALGMVISVVRSVSQPVAALTEAAQKIAEGSYDQQITVRSQDEVGQLAAAFNNMARAIIDHQQDLRQQAATLAAANQDLETARQQALDANRLKSAFLATMSHELRTPLNAIIGYSQIILAGMAGTLTEKQFGFMDRIFANSEALLRLIDDILDLSKIEAGRMELFPQPMEIAGWLRKVQDQVLPQAKSKGLVLEADVDPYMPPVIVADPDRLQQIALNLLSNAIKFTSAGTVRLSLMPVADGFWELAVSDTGIGIASHAQELIFEPFRQADDTSRREYGGTGLGLSIVRQLTAMMGGTIRVKSQPGEGSTFTLRLPLTVADAQEPQALAPVIIEVEKR
jgi:signal transduction histidine kinase